MSARARRSPGWVPNQHGAWAMLLAPFVVGVALSRTVTLTQVVLLAFWLAGYFAFFATGLWLKARRRPRYWPPVRAYVPLAAALGLGVLALDVHLLRWAPLFVVPMTVGLYAAAARHERSLWSGLSTTVGACLMTPVAADAGGGPAAGWPVLWWATAALMVYLAGTVLFVKTMIRERGERAYYLLSVGYHAAATLAALALPAPRHLALAAFFALATARAALLPRRRMSPAAVGMVELVLTLALVLLVSVP